MVSARNTFPAAATAGRECLPCHNTGMKDFDSLYAELAKRATERPEGSGTVAALDEGIHHLR